MKSVRALIVTLTTSVARLNLSCGSMISTVASGTSRIATSGRFFDLLHGAFAVCAAGGGILVLPALVTGFLCGTTRGFSSSKTDFRESTVAGVHVAVDSTARLILAACAGSSFRVILISWRIEYCNKSYTSAKKPSLPSQRCCCVYM